MSPKYKIILYLANLERTLQPSHCLLIIISISSCWYRSVSAPCSSEQSLIISRLKWINIFDVGPALCDSMWLQCCYHCETQTGLLSDSRSRQAWLSLAGDWRSVTSQSCSLSEPLVQCGGTAETGAWQERQGGPSSARPASQTVQQLLLPPKNWLSFNCSLRERCGVIIVKISGGFWAHTKTQTGYSKF